jgi:PAS domain S-box-containing protein
MQVRAPWAQEEELVIQRSRPRARFVTDRDGVVCDLNLDACVMLDYGRRFLLGKRLALLVARDDVPQLERLLQSIDGHSAPANLRFRNRVGSLHPVAIRAALASDSGRVRWTAQLDSARMARA